MACLKLSQLLSLLSSILKLLRGRHLEQIEVELALEADSYR